MDRHFFFFLAAAQRHPNVEAVLWGPTFEGYSPDKTLKQNLLHRYGSLYFDMVFAYGINNNDHVKEISSEVGSFFSFFSFNKFSCCYQGA